MIEQPPPDGEGSPDELELDTRPSPRKKLLVWIVVIALALPALFYLFEYVVPRLLPVNF